MRVAIVHDDLMRRGGAEKVVKIISDMYPEAPIYTLAYRPELTYPEFKNRKIITSWFQVFARNEKLMKWLFFPLGILAMKSLKLKDYDLVIMSTTYCAKYVSISSRTKVVAYCYTPFRLAWSPESYSVYTNSKGLLRVLFNLVILLIRKIDYSSTLKIDNFIAMTKETRDRIINAYSRGETIPIINPSVELSNFPVKKEFGDYYLVVSRFEPYKKVDLVIDAFNENGKKLIIVGKGSQEKELRKMARTNISFEQNVSNERLANLYVNCKAFIFPQHEDYGLTPLEANAAGRPVIAFNKGGVLDTMVSFDEDPENATALFFDEQTVHSLNAAVERLDQIKFDFSNIRKNAERFSEQRFKSEFLKFIEKI